MTVAHYPPGTSKWKIERRMFCHITQNWRGRRWRHWLLPPASLGETDDDAVLMEGADK